MSLQGITGFVEQLNKDPQLQERVAEVTAGGDVSTGAEAVAALGSEQGFEFTAAEAVAARDALLKLADMPAGDDGALSAEDLEAVAGGDLLLSFLKLNTSDPLNDPSNYEAIFSGW